MLANKPAAEAAGTGDAHLLPEHRPDGQLFAVDVTRNPQSRERRHGRSQHGVATEPSATAAGSASRSNIRRTRPTTVVRSRRSSSWRLHHNTLSPSAVTVTTTAPWERLSALLYHVLSPSSKPGIALSARKANSTPAGNGRRNARRMDAGRTG